MSVFRVRLSNSRQGLLDIYDNQRSAYITGPNRITRKLMDGETFVDCNYWKRFAYPSLSLEEAFIEVVEDDGTIYSDYLENNTYPRVYDISALANSQFEENKVDIMGDTGSFALFTQITNKNESDEVKVRINGMNSAVITLPSGSTQSFDAGELSVGSLEIANDSENQVEVQILLSIKVVATS